MRISRIHVRFVPQLSSHHFRTSFHLVASQLRAMHFVAVTTPPPKSLNLGNRTDCNPNRLSMAHVSFGRTVCMIRQAAQLLSLSLCDLIQTRFMQQSMQTRAIGKCKINFLTIFVVCFNFRSLDIDLNALF